MTKVLVPKEISLIASSSEANGAINKSSDGSQFEIQLQNSLRIPEGAKNITIDVEESAIWWVIPNIETGINDRLVVDYDDGVNPVFNIDTLVPQGLYDLDGLNVILSTIFENEGVPADLFTLVADESTQKVIIRFNYTNTTFYLSGAQTFRDILGFNAADIGTAGVAPLNIIADNVAAFNTVNYFLIHSDLVSRGIRFNNTYNQTISQVLIDVSPGSQIVSKPFNPARVEAQEISGTARTNIRFWLTDDLNRPVNTNFEDWSCRVLIRYLVPLEI